MSEENPLDTRGRESARIEDVHLLVEMTDYCNCRCIMCKQSMSKTMHGNIPKQYMDFSLFIKIIEDLKEGKFKVTSIDPLWSGESTIHPDFKEMMYYLFNMNKTHNLFRGLVLNTNAINLDEELSEILLNYAKYVQAKKDTYFMKIYFSIDAATPKTYEKIKNVPGKNLDKVIKNIAYFIKRRRELKLSVPNLIFGFIVMPENQNEAGLFSDLCTDIFKDSGVPYEIVASWPLLTDRDSVYFRQLICSEPKKAEELHRDVCLKLGLIKKSKSAIKEKPKPKSLFRPPCGALWRTPNIASNGEVVSCCRDIELTMPLGNIKEKSLYDIWNGERITELRLSHIKGEFTVPFAVYPTCLNCLEPEGGALPDEDIYAYLKSINKTEIMETYLNRKQQSCG